MKKLISLISLVLMGSTLFVWQSVAVSAASANDVVINEIAWAGSSDASSDEWIELYNNTGQDIDLSGWYIEDDGSSKYKIATGTIAAHGYFLIEDNENAVSNKQADALASLSLANAGDKLVLYDGNGLAIDTVNGSGGAWYGGNATAKSTMERIDPSTGDISSNWASALSGNGSLGSGGSSILGTPGSANGNYGGSGPQVFVNPAALNTNKNQNISIGVEIKNALDLYAYGFDITYDPTVLKFLSAGEATFLKTDGTTTAFQVAKDDYQEGDLVIANARLINPAKGIDGSGKLFDLNFQVIGNDGLDSDIIFESSSFVSDSKGLSVASFKGSNIKIGSASNVSAVKNLQANLGTQKYSLMVKWDVPDSGADNYLIYKKDYKGNFVNIATTVNTNFVDDDSVSGGGKIVPTVNYVYRVIAVKAGQQSQAMEITGSETRGIKGDNDRSGRVDGRDLENLARSFASDYGDEEYNALVDTNFDGTVDGKDLIDIGVSFGMKE